MIGTPLAYRERHEIESLVGFFVNTLVLRTQLSGKPSFVDYLQQCREEDLAAFDHQLYRFEALAEAIGVRLRALAEHRQVMVVTHAPQVAALASHHLFIRKSGSKTVTTQVDVLDDAARAEEVARMLSGATISDEARQAAHKLLQGVA